VQPSAERRAEVIAAGAAADVETISSVTFAVLLTPLLNSSVITPK
jgi:hypothetical protein